LCQQLVGIRNTVVKIRHFVVRESPAQKHTLNQTIPTPACLPRTDAITMDEGQWLGGATVRKQN